MQGVRLVSTPAANRRGKARGGRPESVLAMLEKSMAGRKLLTAGGIRNEPSSCPACSPALCTVLTLYAVFGPLGTRRGMVELARFLRGPGSSLPPLVAWNRHTPEPSECASLVLLDLPSSSSRLPPPAKRTTNSESVLAPRVIALPRLSPARTSARPPW